MERKKAACALKVRFAFATVTTRSVPAISTAVLAVVVAAAAAQRRRKKLAENYTRLA